MTTTAPPPFAPPHPGEADLALLLTQGERKRTGHLFNDCPALDVITPGRAKACKPCLVRWQEIGATGSRHQAAFDAAWYAQAVASDPIKPQERTVNLEAEQEVWEAIAVNDIPAPAPTAHRPNKFGGKCVHCGAWVEAAAGALGKDGSGKWVVAHIAPCPVSTPVPAAAATEPAGFTYGPDGSYAPEPLRAGPYRLADGTVVRIQISRQSGKPYALALDEAGTYIGGGRKLDGAVRLTLDEAKGYGRETGTCCVCGAHLENPESVAAGIGPICGGRM